MRSARGDTKTACYGPGWRYSYSMILFKISLHLVLKWGLDSKTIPFLLNYIQNEFICMAVVPRKGLKTELSMQENDRIVFPQKPPMKFIALISVGDSTRQKWHHEYQH